ncbi:hypothetical protein HYH02_012172 [Chlamydomonas schloesseri]|uniref:SGNH hydrolase-type esterase domain-containing protein n=1 Tax=Chlamydomonas schloesseri TaxID=2026947 RepID=A0A835T8S6_9CHLO|nr:hypothetical protein HYH02_012172 [Chlamydomonas schloesseri]|eukprot:KAG2434505.1 hypothetical protein HYH02_012172 [Chlamydomonas schloesseri]
MNRTRNRPELGWDWGHTWSTVEVNRQPVSTLLSSVFGGYRFTLPKLQLQRGTAYVGAASRLRRLVKELLLPHSQKTNFKVAVIGGSISWGQFTSKRGQTDWFSTFTRWMISAFPRANITGRNGCTPGVPTPYMIMCLELSLDPDVDLVIMEYTLNDGLDPVLFGNRVVQDMERLVRRVLALPSRPAVVLLQVPSFGMAGYRGGHPKNNKNPADAFAHFYETSEDAQVAISQYYDVSYLSLRTALYRLAAQKATPGFLWEDTFVDHHPGDHGHKVMADLMVHLVQRTAVGLLLEPFGAPDAEAITEPLPEPMYDGNTAPNATMCLVGDAFRSHLVSAQGFDWVNEGSTAKPKPGYVATQPGSKLRLRVDTDRSGLGSAPGERVALYLHHLRSYEHMGAAALRCVSGCNCSEVRVDAHISERVSQVYLVKMEVSQSAACEVEVEVLRDSRSGEHKFKVSGLVVAERAGGPSAAIEQISGDNKSFGLRQHNGDDEQMVIAKGGQPGKAGGVHRHNHRRTGRRRRRSSRRRRRS